MDDQHRRGELGDERQHGLFGFRVERNLDAGVEEGLYYARDRIAEGRNLADPLGEMKVFPGMVVQMVAVGEEAGSLDEMSAKVADFYEEDVDNAVDNLSSLLEPMIMAILGVLVGGLVVAMYLPIFKMGAVV